MPATLHIDEAASIWNVAAEYRARELAVRPLLVLMHGMGSHEFDLRGLFPLLPDAFVCVSVRAPLVFGPGAYAWQPDGGQQHPTPEIFDAPAQAVETWLDSVAHTYGSAGTSTSLLGFSQGAAMVSQLFRRDAGRYAAGVFLSGFLARLEVSGDARLAAAAPPLFWGRDLADPVITPTSIAYAQEFLPQHFAVTERHYTGVGHGISREEVRDISDFLRTNVISAAAGS